MWRGANTVSKHGERQDVLDKENNNLIGVRRTMCGDWRDILDNVRLLAHNASYRQFGMEN